MANQKPYPSDVSDEEWLFVAPYLILFLLDAGQRKYALREVFAVRYVVRSGCPWHMLPNDLPPSLVYQQMRRWLAAGCFEDIVHDLRVLLHLADGRKAHSYVIIMDSRTIQATPSRTGTGYDAGPPHSDDIQRKSRKSAQNLSSPIVQTAQKAALLLKIE